MVLRFLGMKDYKLSDYTIDEWLDICKPQGVTYPGRLMHDDMFKALTELKEFRAKEMKDFEIKRTEVELYIEENFR
jgi:hypothetical protein